MAGFNCLHVLSSARKEVELYVDACNSLVGPLLGDKAYALELPDWFQKYNFHINCLEAFNVLIAIRTRAEDLSHKTVPVKTDNPNACFSVSTRRSQVYDRCKPRTEHVKTTHVLCRRNFTGSYGRRPLMTSAWQPF